MDGNNKAIMINRGLSTKFPKDRIDVKNVMAALAANLGKLQKCCSEKPEMICIINLSLCLCTFQSVLISNQIVFLYMCESWHEAVRKVNLPGRESNITGVSNILKMHLMCVSLYIIEFYCQYLKPMS